MALLQAKSFNAPEATRTLPKTRMDLLSFEDLTVLKTTLDVGWRWSEHVKPEAGTQSCQAPHLICLLAGRVHVVMDDGTEADISPGDVVAVPPGHDAWVVGNEPCVSLDFQGWKLRSNE
jgi:quercetin dioxygenase-like cupin family protein